MLIDHLRARNDVAANRLRDTRAVNRAEEVQHSRHDDGVCRLDGACRNGRSNSIRRIVKTIDEIEQQGEHDDRQDEELQLMHTSSPRRAPCPRPSRNDRAYLPDTPEDLSI